MKRYEWKYDNPGEIVLSFQDDSGTLCQMFFAEEEFIQLIEDANPTMLEAKTQLERRRETSHA